MVRNYHEEDLGRLIDVFNRAVHEIAVRDIGVHLVGAPVTFNIGRCGRYVPRRFAE